jgi:hypothetical protein
MKKRPDMSELERLELVRKKAEVLERQARREEQLIRNGTISDGQGNNTDIVERSIAVNDRYMEAINAKLKILDQI